MSDIDVPQEVLDQLLIPSTATLTAQLSGLGLWNTFMHDVRPLKPGMKMAGSAFTMRYIPAREDLDRIPMDNLTDVQRIGIEQIGEGEILVIDAREDTHAGTMGNILATRIHQRGAVGIVTDGAYRDSPAIADIGIPAYARAMNANTNKTIHHPVDIQLPIACGGVSVYPGDIIVGETTRVWSSCRGSMQFRWRSRASNRNGRKPSSSARSNRAPASSAPIPLMRKRWLSSKSGRRADHECQKVFDIEIGIQYGWRS